MGLATRPDHQPDLLVMSSVSRKIWSLSVGIDCYRDARIGRLRYSVDDAAAFHGALENTFGEGDLDAALLKDSDASLRAVRREIGERIASGAKKQDIVLLFFAGHGSPETSSGVDRVSRYFVLHDTEYDGIFSTGLSMERDFVHLLGRLQASTVVVFLDSCFSGAAGGRTFEGPVLERLARTTRAPRDF